VRADSGAGRAGSAQADPDVLLVRCVVDGELRADRQLGRPPGPGRDAGHAPVLLVALHATRSAPESMPTSRVTASKTAERGTACATSVATRRNADCSSVSRAASTAPARPRRQRSHPERGHQEHPRLVVTPPKVWSSKGAFQHRRSLQLPGSGFFQQTGRNNGCWPRRPPTAWARSSIADGTVPLGRQWRSAICPSMCIHTRECHHAAAQARPSGAGPRRR
jgi:hypothetical protein